MNGILHHGNLKDYLKKVLSLLLHLIIVLTIYYYYYYYYYHNNKIRLKIKESYLKQHNLHYKQ